MNHDVIKHEISFRRIKIKRLLNRNKTIRNQLRLNYSYIKLVERELKHLNDRLKEEDENGNDEN